MGKSEINAQINCRTQTTFHSWTKIEEYKHMTFKVGKKVID